MSFLRRLLSRPGGGSREDAATPAGDETQLVETPGPAAEGTLDHLEREHELEVLREDQGRLDELQERQLRYARYAWQPPAQGGERRADDADRAEGGG